MDCESKLYSDYIIVIFFLDAGDIMRQSKGNTTEATQGKIFKRWSKQSGNKHQWTPTKDKKLADCGDD